MEKFKEVLERETDGSVQVTIFPHGQLGNEEQEIQGVRLGHIDATVVAAGNLASLVPELDLFNLPFVFRDKEHFYRVISGPVGQWVGRAVEQQTDTIFLGYWPIGTRVAWNSQKPAVTPEDFKGLKVRVMASPILLDTFDAFGAQATSMSWGELYSAVQMGVLDGGECSLADILVEKFYEVSRYVTVTNHLIGVAAFIFNKQKYEQLSPSMQAAVFMAANAASQAARQADEEFTDDAERQLRGLGMQFQEVDQSLYKAKVDPLYEKYARRVGGMDLIEQMARQ
jgi:tripartite ATP-independent transporter DctP family solute receptor